MFERCEELDQGSGSDAALTHELMIDRWRGLCRAVFTGKTEQLMPNARELYNAMDEARRPGCGSRPSARRRRRPAPSTRSATSSALGRGRSGQFHVQPA